jgi:hypothetical protein
MKPALSIGLHGINMDLRLVHVAAFRAPQGPVLKAGTRRDSALDCHAGLASGTARTLGCARRQFGRRRLQIGHGIDPGKSRTAISQWPKNNHNRMITGIGTPSSQSRSPRSIVASMKTLWIQKRKKRGCRVPP